MSLSVLQATLVEFVAGGHGLPWLQSLDSETRLETAIETKVQASD